MLHVPVAIDRPFGLTASPAVAFAFLRDVPAWGALFPHVETVEPLDGEPEAFVWTLEPLGPPGVAVRTVYACRYVPDDDARTLTWTPVEGVGNARFQGGVALAPGTTGGTDGRLWLRATLEIPAPGFARAVVAPAVQLAFRQMMATFLERLDAALGGG